MVDTIVDKECKSKTKHRERGDAIDLGGYHC